MECESMIEHLLNHSKQTLLETLNSVKDSSCSRLAAGFLSEDTTLYNQELALLKHLLKCAHKKNDYLNNPDLVCLATDVADKLCLRLLVNMCQAADDRKHLLELFSEVYKVMAACVKVHVDVLSVVLESVMKSLEHFLEVNSENSDDHSSTGVYDIQTALEILRHVLAQRPLTVNTDLKTRLPHLFDKLTCAVSFLSKDLIGTACIPVLLHLLELDEDDRAENLQKLWLCIQGISKLGVDETSHYVLLCGMANWFFPSSGFGSQRLNVIEEEVLWKMLQSGLVNHNTLTRKRSLYLVKRIVDICQMTEAEVSTGLPYPYFWWDKQQGDVLTKTWEDFLLLAEVFEEKQVHVIRPLLPRMKNLIKATTSTGPGGVPLLHTSWLIAVLARSSKHESLQVIRWSAETALGLDLHTCPLMPQGQQKCLMDQLLQTLKETKLFNREQGSPNGRVPALAEKLVHFLQTSWQVLPTDDRGVFFSDVIQGMSRSNWAPVPLLYLCRGLSLVPSSPCLDTSSLAALRKLMTGDLVTVETYLRGAIMGFIVQQMVNLIDKSRVSLEDMMQVLALSQLADCLQRGTTLWDQCVQWLKDEPGGDNCVWSREAIRKHCDSAVSKYLEVTLDSRFNTADTVAGQTLARLLLLAADASIITHNTASDDPDVLSRVFEKLAVIINSINSHSYMSTHKADKAAQFLVLTVRELVPKNCDPSDPVAKVILSTIEACQSELLVYIGNQMQESVETLHDRPLLSLYEDCVDMLTGVAHLLKGVNFQRLTETCMAMLKREVESKQVTLHSRMRQLSAMSLLGRIAGSLCQPDTHLAGSQALCQLLVGFLNGWTIVTHFEKPSSECSVTPQEWGKMTSLYLQHQWQVALLGLQDGAATWCRGKELLALATDTLAVGLEETSITVMQCLRHLIHMTVSASEVTDEELVTVVGAGWSSVRESRRSSIVWSVLDSFVQMAFQPALLAKDHDSPVLHRLRQCAEDLINYGTEKTGVVNILVSQLTRAWLEPGMVQHTVKLAPVIVELCKFGGQPTRGQRQLYDVSATVEALGDQCAVNGLVKSITNGDLLVRATIIDFLCCLEPGSATAGCLATELVQLCASSYVDVLQGSSNKYANSLVHRKRHRLIQTILLLESFVTEDYVPELWRFLWTSLEQECQPSIRHNVEWIVITVMARNPKYGRELWVLFDKHRDSKNIVLCSLLCVVIHLGPHLPKQEQEDYYQHALHCVLPWCMAHHFTTRIFASATLCRLWTQCQELGLGTVLAANPVLQTLVTFNQQNRNSTTNVKKLLDSFFFRSLDFKKDFTLEVIYHILPMMTDLTEEDWIKPDTFIQVNSAWAEKQRSAFICLHKPSNHLTDFQEDKWKYTTLKIAEDEDGGDMQAEGSGDVQKKIMPWKQMMPDLETLDEIDHGVKSHKEGGLVVVTSLISKVPNLGGLCRTSEIFGVSEYVLGKLRHTEDKAFQGLSVTAHKWLPITEVQEQKLSDYLQHKREAGYTLVGVEQTANSVCLTNYTFPEKTLLLLGNEKEGIPVELISLLDVCVEIPQQGVVRSLNVHVSGALLIWEYRRQQLIKMPATDS